jgi:cobalt/nickel transport system permease protein
MSVSRNTMLLIGAIAAILITGVVLSQFSSDDPDGLEFVAEQQGFDETAETHSLESAPLAGYGDSSIASTAIAAVVGVALTAGIGFGLFWFLRKKPDTPTVQ